jgi:hypothetical protein
MSLEEEIASLVQSSRDLTKTVMGQVEGMKKSLADAFKKFEDALKDIKKDHLAYTEMIWFDSPREVLPFGLSEAESINFTFTLPEHYEPQKDGEACYGIIDEFARLRDLGPGNFELHLLLSVGEKKAQSSTTLSVVRYQTEKKSYFDSPTEPFLLKPLEGNQSFSVLGQFDGSNLITRNITQLASFPDGPSYTSLKILNLGSNKIQIHGIGIVKKVR